LTNPLTNDGILARQSTSGRDIGAVKRPDSATEQTGTEAREASSPATTDVERAQQRLAQEAARSSDPAIASPEQARSLMAELTQQLADDPGAALRAVAQVSDTLYEAATARPTS
jgi:hypothetical protein